MTLLLAPAALNRIRVQESNSWRVEVLCKPNLLDARGAALRAQLPWLGVQGVTDVRVDQLYRLSGRLTQHQAVSIAQQLLADPITQEYRVNGHPSNAVPSQTPCCRIEAWLKTGVTDRVGESVRRAILDMGLPIPEEVRCATVYRFFGRFVQAQAERVAAKMLGNPLIHRFEISLGRNAP
ncbi:MAG: phosphoribosylformylglycinamidine synthase subunit PurS [Elusimicrobia bacterium]|nr:phosphoribosylformylglycinamidine synthase subunit PurS [Elusimicrobiota bacterium]